MTELAALPNIAPLVLPPMLAVTAGDPESLLADFGQLLVAVVEDAAAGDSEEKPAKQQLEDDAPAIAAVPTMSIMTMAPTALPAAPIEFAGTGKRLPPGTVLPAATPVAPPTPSAAAIETPAGLSEPATLRAVLAQLVQVQPESAPPTVARPSMPAAEPTPQPADLRLAVMREQTPAVPAAALLAPVAPDGEKPATAKSSASRAEPETLIRPSSPAPTLAAIPVSPTIVPQIIPTSTSSPIPFSPAPVATVQIERAIVALETATAAQPARIALTHHVFGAVELQLARGDDGGLDVRIAAPGGELRGALADSLSTRQPIEAPSPALAASTTQSERRPGDNTYERARQHEPRSGEEQRHGRGRDARDQQADRHERATRRDDWPRRFGAAD